MMSEIPLRSINESILPTIGETLYDQALLQTALAVGDACAQLAVDDTPPEGTSYLTTALWRYQSRY